jgi:hypothetical protein
LASIDLLIQALRKAGAALRKGLSKRSAKQMGDYRARP